MLQTRAIRRRRVVQQQAGSHAGSRTIGPMSADTPSPAVDPGVGALAETLGIRRTSMGGGRSAFALTASAAHMNPHGVVHGGVVYTLVDYAMGGAVTSQLAPGERCATIEVKIHYLATAEAGEIVADATVVSRTRRIAVLEARAHDGAGRLLALATGTYYIQAPARGA
jgi:acyl-CoA thioesterase